MTSFHGLRLPFLTVLAAAGLARAASAAAAPAPDPAAHVTPGNRVASVFLSQDLINEALSRRVKSDLVKDLKVLLEPERDRILLRGILHIPVEELKAVNLDPSMGAYRFQVTISPKTTRKGHLILSFPLEETFFTPLNSKDPEHDRVIVPTQLLSLALASARGYLAALSGDFSGFDRRTRKLEAQIAALERAIKGEGNADARDALNTERESLKLQLEAVPLERKQLAAVAKQFEQLVGFTGENELNLNEELAAHRNALVLHLKLGQFVPYLQGIELGGVRVLRDKNDGAGENFLAVDFNAQLDKYEPPTLSTPTARPPEKRAPDVVIRLNQALFESTAMLAAEGNDLGPKLKDFRLHFREDGLHARGAWRTPLLISIPFHAILDLVWVDVNAFELRVREMEIADIDVKGLTGLVLELAKKRLDAALKGICTFQYVGKEGDRSRAVRVLVNMPGLIPAFPDLALTGITTKDGELLLKAGKF